MGKIEIGFEWTRAGRYECGPSPAHKGAHVIRQVGRARETYRPLEIDLANLHLRFAALDGSDESILGFAKAWGLLETPAREGAVESVDGWRREIRKMRGALSVLGAKDAAPGGVLRSGSNTWRASFKVTKIDALLSGNPGSRPTLILQPPTLISAMSLQLANSIASGTSIRQCVECGTWFHAGLGDKARRSVAIFCSTECKNRHHYKQRKAQR